MKLPGAPLAETIELVARAASRDEVRPILTGVLSRPRATTADDGRHRLLPAQRQARRAREPRSASALEANIPARALRELARIIAAEGAEEVEIALPRNQVVFARRGRLPHSRLIEGQFPSWRQLSRSRSSTRCACRARSSSRSRAAISQLAQRNAPLRLAFAEGELTVAAETPDIGDASEAMPAPYSGEPLEIAFNPQFLVEGIESVGSEELAIQLSSPLRPGLLRPVDGEDFSYLVMPIRLNA